MQREVGGEPIFLLGRLLESCEDDELLAWEVLQDFLASTPRRLTRLAAAVAAHNTVLVRLEAHSITGSSDTIGARSLAEVCKRLETAGKSGELSNAPVLLAEAERRYHTLRGVLTAHLANQ